MKTLILDPGHGPGEAHRRGGLLFPEGDQNFALAKALEKEAIKRNIPVKLTRKQMEDPSLQERGAMGKANTLFLSLHSNAGPPHIRGTEVYDSLRAPARELAKALGQATAKALRTPYRGTFYRLYSYEGEWKVSATPLPASDYYGVLRHNGADAAFLLEIGYHTNEKDSRHILRYREDLVCALLDTLYPATKETKLYRGQTGAFRNRNHAEAMVRRLKAQGIPAYIRET